ncbi:MAG: hypothetical protein V4710_08450 [Verrucomicrobiota bacterium]
MQAPGSDKQYAGTAAPRSSRRWIALFLVFILIAAGSLAAAYHRYTERPQVFVQRWSERFRALDSFAAAEQLRQSVPVYVRTLPSGEWFIATCEHSCCSGAGFDATVIRDSTGAIYADTTHTFCGIEGMSAELDAASSDSLSVLYKRLNHLHLQKQ